MRSMRSLLTLLATLLVATGLTVPAANAAPIVTQGDRIFINMIGSRAGCTLAHIDHGKRQALTSSHCVTVPGMTVTDAHGTPIGRVLTPTMSPIFGQNDYARIALNPGVRGHNRFSGDAIIHPAHVRPGERVCHYGATTRTERCGWVHAVRGGAIIFKGVHGTVFGDSGGPVWIPGRGLVGVYVGYRSDGMSVASAPFFYFGPDLLWRHIDDVTQPVTVTNILRRYFYI